MKRDIEIKSIQDLEQELYIIQKCEIVQDQHWRIQDALDSISREIEGSIADEELDSSDGWAKNLLSKFLFRRALKNKNLNLEKSPTQNTEEDTKYSQIRLKTAITAFKLHSGPFSLHPKFGKLNKSEWEKWIGYITSISLGNIQIIGDEKLRKVQEERKTQKENFQNSKNSEAPRKNKKKHFRKHHHKHRGYKK
jgi:hypothetical protein